MVLDDNLSRLDRTLRLARRLSSSEYRIEPEMFSTVGDVKAPEDLIGIDKGRIACQGVKVKDEYEY